MLHRNIRPDLGHSAERASVSRDLMCLTMQYALVSGRAPVYTLTRTNSAPTTAAMAIAAIPSFRRTLIPSGSSNRVLISKSILFDHEELVSGLGETTAV